MLDYPETVPFIVNSVFLIRNSLLKITLQLCLFQPFTHLTARNVAKITRNEIDKSEVRVTYSKLSVGFLVVF
jgi:hypothetical protein